MLSPFMVHWILGKPPLSSRPLPYTFIALFILAVLSGCQDQSPSPTQSSSQTSTQTLLAERLIEHLPFAAPAHNLLVDDIDGDGRLDLALTSHHENYTQVFYQRAPRQFSPGRQIEEVGFHPGELMRYPFFSDRRLYIMNAEGVNRLRVFEPDRNGDLRLIAELGAKAPRSGAFFTWPSWGKGIALTPFAESAIYLVKDFDPLTGRFGGSIELPFRPEAVYAHAVAAADIDHDGSDELFFTNTLSNVVSIIREPVPGAEPIVEPLWTFNPGGRAERVIPADIDQDGDIDLLIPDATDKRPLDRTDINVLINDGQGRFALVTIPFPSRPRSAGGMTGIRTIDFAKDQDGNGYIAAPGYETLVFMRIPSGWKGETPESRSIPFQGVQTVTQARLVDIDGDGWLDLAFSRTHDLTSGVILWGPVWEHAKQLADAGIKID